MCTSNAQRSPSRPGRHRPVLLALVLLGTVSTLAGCHSVLVGMGVGALTGQAIGGNTESTVAGAAYGAWVGAAAENTWHHAYHQQQHRWCYDY